MAITHKTAATGGDSAGLIGQTQWNEEHTGPIVDFITLNANYTGVNQAALQKIFNSPAAGAIALDASTTYFFECEFSVSGLSSTSGTMLFGGLGTVGIAQMQYVSLALKSAAAATPGTAQLSFQSAANMTAKAITSANTSVAGAAKISGKIITSTAGTFIPAMAQTNATAPTFLGGSTFKIWKAGASSVLSVGAWS